MPEALKPDEYAFVDLTETGHRTAFDRAMQMVQAKAAAETATKRAESDAEAKAKSKATASAEAKAAKRRAAEERRQAQDANHCLRVGYEKRVYRVNVSNGCDHPIRVEHCERARSDEAMNLFATIMGGSGGFGSCPKMRCRSYELASGSGNTFTFVRNFDDESVPPIYKMNSPLANELTATRQ